MKKEILQRSRNAPKVLNIPETIRLDMARYSILAIALLVLSLLTGCAGGDQITGKATFNIDQSCSNIAIDLVKIGGKSSICYDSGFIYFNVENIGEDAVGGVIVEADKLQNTIIKKISKGEIISGKAVFAVNPDRVVITPVSENNIICNDRTIIFEGIESCR